MKLADKDCARGSEVAQGFWAVSYGLIDLKSDPLLRTFREKAKAIPEHNRALGIEPPQDENESVATLMMTNIVEEIVDGQPWDAV